MNVRGMCYNLRLALSGRDRQQSLLENLQQAEKAPISEITRVQEELLRKLLRHAFFNVPYYRRILDGLGGLEYLESHKPTVVLRKMPLLTKDIIRENFNDLKSNDLSGRRWYYNSSGGSTGEPIKLIQDQDCLISSSALKMLFDNWTGYSVGMPKIVLWGSERDLFGGRIPIKNRVGRCLRNERWLNSFRMTECDMRDYVQIINNFRPVQILAYVEAIYQIARFIEQEGLDVYSPKAIMTSAGTLYPQMREVIEEVFQAPVFNRYGSREVSDIACECEAHKGLHVSPLTHYVEIITKDGTPAALGEVGEVIVTWLVNYAMPLIRYRIGDLARWESAECSCNRHWPLLKEVTGRVTDAFLRADGGVVMPEYFIHMLGVVVNAPWIRKFQVVQEKYDLIRLLVVPSDTHAAIEGIDKSKDTLEQIVRVAMGNECSLEIEIVDEIPSSPSGKYRYTISKVQRHV